MEIIFHRHYEGMNSNAIEIHNERQLIKADKKYNQSNNHKTKLRALLEECYCYYIRNTLYHKDMPDFNTFVQHWSEAHRGVIPDIFLDQIEAQYGALEGPLYLVRGHSYWNTSRDWRDDSRPERNNDEQSI